jgi:predicted permease
MAGLPFAQAGLEIPALIDLPMRWMGAAFGPLALALVGLTLGGASVRAQLRWALGLTAIKNLLVPALAALLGTAMGMRGLPFSVMCWLPPCRSAPTCSCFRSVMAWRRNWSPPGLRCRPGFQPSASRWFCCW